MKNFTFAGQFLPAAERGGWAEAAIDGLIGVSDLMLPMQTAAARMAMSAARIHFPENIYLRDDARQPSLIARTEAGCIVPLRGEPVPADAEGIIALASRI